MNGNKDVKKHNDIYIICKEAFVEQSTVQQILNTKANIYLSLLSLLVGIQFLKFNDFIYFTNKLQPCWFYIVMIFYISSIICFGFAIWFVIRVLKIKEYMGYPTKIYTDFHPNNINHQDFLSSMAKYLEEATEENRTANDNKAHSLKISLQFIRTGLFFIFGIFLSWIVNELMRRYS